MIEADDDDQINNTLFRVSGGGASMTNFVFNCSANFERVVVYVCLTVIAIVWIVYGG